MKKMTTAELAVKYAREALLRQAIEVISKSKSLEEAIEKVRALIDEPIDEKPVSPDGSSEK